MSFEDIFNRRNEHREDKNTEQLRIEVDFREKNSLVISELIHLNFKIDWNHLPVADYIINGIAIERKTISDFISSMINKRLTKQLEELQQYEKKLLIIEGIDEQELYNNESNVVGEGVHSNAIRGFLLSILLKDKIPIIFSKNYEDTAKFLYVLARKKEQEHVSLIARKKAFNKKEQMQYIIESFPGIGPVTAKKLLKKYKTIKNIINANIEELKKDIGKKAEIFEIAEEGY